MSEKTPLAPPPDYATATTLPTRPRPSFDIPALLALRGKRTILASTSPRRKQLLAQLGLTDIEIVPSAFPEDLDKNTTPFEYVLATAEGKAMAVYKAEIDSAKGEPALIIAADTVVVGPMGEILEKPRSEKHHLSMLKGLRSSGWHKVYTAVVCMAPREDAVTPGYRIRTCVEETSVKFDPSVSDELIMAYVKTREGADKAGGYGIQGMGSVLVEKIEGTFDNVVGLPIRATLKVIEKIMNEDDGEDEDEEEE